MNNFLGVQLPIVINQSENKHIATNADVSSENGLISDKGENYNLIHPDFSYSHSMDRKYKSTQSKNPKIGNENTCWVKVNQSSSRSQQDKSGFFNMFVNNTSLTIENPFSPNCDRKLSNISSGPKTFKPTLLKLDMGDMKESKISKAKTLSPVSSGSMNQKTWCNCTDVANNESHSYQEDSVSNSMDCDKLLASEESYPIMLTEEDLTSPTKSKNTMSASKSSKLNKFQLRMDVVSKTIFRNMKAYYVSGFKEVFDFTKRRKRVNPDHSAEVYKQAKLYLSNKFGEEVGDMGSVFVALIDSKQKFTKADLKYPTLKSDINSLLRAFNMKKAERLLNIPELSKLVLNYLKTSDCIEKLSKNSQHPSVISAYEKKIQEFKEMSCQTLELQ